MSELPFVSVVAPCRNEVGFIESAISSILSGDYPADKIELLIVDGMSTDGTRNKATDMAEGDARIRVLDNPDRIVPSAMNTAIKAAKGDYIVRIDCHCCFASDYISKCVEVAKRTGADNVGGYIETLPGADTKTAKAIAAATSSQFGVGNSAFRIGGNEREVDTVPFGTYKKDSFEKIGYYDERLVRNQDIELNSRIRKAGGKIIISPEIKLNYYNRATYKGIWQQSFNNGLWNPYTVWLVGSGLQFRHFIPMFFILSIIVFGALSIAYWPFVILLGLNTLTYLCAAIYFSIGTGKSREVSTVGVLMSYFALHLAYGLGSLWGALTIPFKFSNRKAKKVGKALSDRI
jgi:glycosyltransferase involved in cell wall biosynthesis